MQTVGLLKLFYYLNSFTFFFFWRYYKQNKRSDNDHSTGHFQSNFSPPNHKSHFFSVNQLLKNSGLIMICQCLSMVGSLLFNSSDVHILSGNLF